MGTKALWRNEKGMTLVELMIGFAILLLLMAASVSIMLFGAKVFRDSSGRERLRLAAEEMKSQVGQELTFATRLALLPAGSDPAAVPYGHVLLVADGQLRGGPNGGPYVSPYGGDVLEGAALALTATVEDAAVLALDFAFAGGSGGAYASALTVRLLNIAAGTEAVAIEGLEKGGVLENPVIVYDLSPYRVVEGFGGEEQVPYTVARYGEDQTPQALSEGTAYAPGDIVVDSEGTRWQAVAAVVYQAERFATHPGSPDTAFWKRLAAEWRNEDRASLYQYHDIISYRGAYYMSTLKDRGNTARPTAYGWVRVYWLAAHSEADKPMLGWSLNPPDAAYLSVYTSHP